jgi:hypothetical protein
MRWQLATYILNKNNNITIYRSVVKLILQCTMCKQQTAETLSHQIPIKYNVQQMQMQRQTTEEFGASFDIQIQDNHETN